DDGVVGDAELVELVKDHADLLVVHHHAVTVGVLPALAEILLSDVSAEVHRSRVVPEEEGLIRFRLLLHPLDRTRGNLLINRFHALLRQRTRVLDLLFPNTAPARLLSRVILVRCNAVEHAAWSEHLLESRILRIVRQLRLFFGIEVIEIAEKDIEAMHRRQVLIAVAKVILAELPGGITEGFEQLGDRRILFLQPYGCPRHADLRETGANGVLSADEACAAGGAALLRVVVGERGALVSNAIDVGCAVSHHPAAEERAVPDADVIAPEDEDVGFLRSHGVIPLGKAESR